MKPRKSGRHSAYKNKKEPSLWKLFIKFIKTKWWYRWVVVGLLAFLLLFVPIFWRGHNWKYSKTFGIRIPMRHAIHGIDISHHQGQIDWAKVLKARSGDLRLRFCYLKATEGGNLVDKKYQKHFHTLQDEDLKIGAYHFYIPWVNPKLQAKNFINTAKIRPGDLVPVLDFERENKRNQKATVENLKIWLDIIEAKYGAKPIIYTNKHLYTKYIEGNLDDYKIWMADYWTLEIDYFKNHRQLVLWQHSDKGKVSGVYGKVDFNVFLGNEADFKEICIPE